MDSTLIRPGLLVSLKSAIRGGVSYQTRTIDADHAQGDARVAKWETTREIANAAEHEAGLKARSLARTAVTRACCWSSFGLLCPIAKEDALAEGIAEARKIADAFNAVAQCSRLEVFVITGRIADNDMEAAKAIGSEVRELLAAMEKGVKAADPKAIREAADRARAVSGMLSDDAKAKVGKAIAEVRSIARDIVRRVEKDSESAASVVENCKLEALAAARFAVLDMEDEPSEAAQIALPMLAIDLESADEVKVADVVLPAIDFDPAATGVTFESKQPAPYVPAFDIG